MSAHDVYLYKETDVLADPDDPEMAGEYMDVCYGTFLFLESAMLEAVRQYRVTKWPKWHIAQRLPGKCNWLDIKLNFNEELDNGQPDQDTSTGTSRSDAAEDAGSSVNANKETAARDREDF